MGRPVLWLVLIGALLATPRVRAELVPHVQPALDPAYEWSARSRVREAARFLQTRTAAGGTLPKPREIGAVLEAKYKRDDASLDPWGTPYYLVRQGKEMVIGSAGRDRRAGTEDDIRVPVGEARK